MLDEHIEDDGGENLEFKREITKALAQSDASYARAVTACGTHDELTITMVESFLTLTAAHQGEIDRTAAFLAKHRGNAALKAKLADRLAARADIFEWEAAELLREWQPPHFSRVG